MHGKNLGLGSYRSEVKSFISSLPRLVQVQAYLLNSHLERTAFSCVPDIARNNLLHHGLRLRSSHFASMQVMLSSLILAFDSSHVRA